MVGHQPNALAAFTPGEIPGTHFQRLSRPQGTWFFCRIPGIVNVTYLLHSDILSIVLSLQTVRFSQHICNLLLLHGETRSKFMLCKYAIKQNDYYIKYTHDFACSLPRNISTCAYSRTVLEYASQHTWSRDSPDTKHQSYPLDCNTCSSH